MTYCQKVEQPSLREVTKYLAEGLECKEILSVRNSQIRLRDSIIYNYQVIVLQHKYKDSIQNNYIVELEQDNKVCNEEYNKLGKQTMKLKSENKLLKITNIVALILLIGTFVR